MMLSHPGSVMELSDLINRPRTEVLSDVRLRAGSNYLGNHTALCRALGRYYMFVDTSDVGFATHIIMGGGWEMWLTEFMIRTIQPGWTCLDVGANFGYYSLLMSDLAQHTGRCIAFEPNPYVAKMLRQTLSVNGFDDRSEVREMALSDGPGTAKFYLPTNEPKNARIVDEVDEIALANGWGTFIDVPVMGLDQAYGGRIDFIKIDAEGAEGAIVHGMWNTIQAHRPRIMIEYNCARMSNPRAGLDILLNAYGSMRSLEYDGHLYDVTIDRVLTERPGIDWLLYLE